MVALFGIVWWWRGRRTIGSAWILCWGQDGRCSAFSSSFPHFNPSGQSPYLSRYNYLGHGLSGIISGMILHPDRVLTALSSLGRQAYLAYLLHPVGLVPLLGAPILLLAGPALAINLLSADPTMYSGLYQYSAEVVPYSVAAPAIVGTRWLSAAGPPLSHAACRLDAGSILLPGSSPVGDRRSWLGLYATGRRLCSAVWRRATSDGGPDVGSGSRASRGGGLPTRSSLHLSGRRWVYSCRRPTRAGWTGRRVPGLGRLDLRRRPCCRGTLHTVARHALEGQYGSRCRRGMDSCS